MGNATLPAQNDDLIDDLVAAIRCARNLAELETVLDAALTRAQGDDPFDADARAARQVRESALKGPTAPAPTIGYWN